MSSVSNNFCKDCRCLSYRKDVLRSAIGNEIEDICISLALQGKPNPISGYYDYPLPRNIRKEYPEKCPHFELKPPSFWKRLCSKL